MTKSLSRTQLGQHKILVFALAMLAILAIVIGVSVSFASKDEKLCTSETSTSLSAHNNGSVNSTKNETAPILEDEKKKKEDGEVKYDNVEDNSTTSSIPFPMDNLDENQTSRNLASSVDFGLAGKIQEGTAAGIPFFHCFGQRSSSHAPMYQFILLHGASFTKEIWETTGILDIFCNDYKDTAVTALDLSIYAKHDDLQSVIDGLKATGIIRNLPISGIVTPSASGATVVDWIFNGDVKSLKEQIVVWIPVAPPSILSYQKADYAKKIGDWHVLAIYGNKDSGGKKISKLVTGAVTDSKVVQLQGGHPVYRDSPEKFVQTIVEYVSQKSD